MKLRRVVLSNPVPSPTRVKQRTLVKHRSRARLGANVRSPMTGLRTLTALLGLSAFSVLAVAQPLELGTLKSIEHVDGCSCELYLGGDKTKLVFMSEFEGDPAWVNLAGSDTKLTLTKVVAPKKFELGSRVTRTYQGPGCTVIARYRVSRVCKPNTECDGFGISGTVSASAGGTNRRSYKVSGLCAC